ncbi:MAG: DUF2142 domain-containing protein, partial [bacterium]|nr:DUF2142 domain-containing protein [bacterium]
MKNVSIEKLFLIIGFIIGCLFIYIIPPFQSPDEDSHFKKAYSISNGNFYESSNGEIIGLKIPVTMTEYISEKLTMASDREKKYSYSDCYYDQLLPGNFSKVSLQEVSTSAATPIAHLIPGIGITIAKIFGPLLVGGSPSVSFMLYFARFFSLLSYLLIGYFALKVTPMFKKSMFAILLMPMSIFLASMVSYDNLLIAISLLTVASILKLIYDKKEMFNKNWFILFTVTGYILLNIKIVYAPLMALLIFVPKEKFKNKENKEKIKTYIRLGLLIILLTIIFRIPNLLLSATESNSLSGKQLSFVLNHPFTYFKILLINLKDQFWPQIYWMIGTFGLLDTYIPPLFIFISLIN